MRTEKIKPKKIYRLKKYSLIDATFFFNTDIVHRYIIVVPSVEYLLASFNTQFYKVTAA